MKSSKKIIQSIVNPKKEHSFVKEPRGELIETTGKSIDESVVHDVSKIITWIKNVRGKKPFQSVHTHPHHTNSNRYGSALPSPADLLYTTSKRNLITTEYIAQQDENTGELQGYTALHNKRTDIINEKEFKRKERLIEMFRDKKRYSSFEPKRRENLAERMGIKIKYHPVRGYYFNKNTGNYEKKEKGLEKIFSSLLLSFAFVFFILQTNLTGNIISDYLSEDYLVGFFGLLICLVVLFFYLILEKKNR
jgi:hypothetical protein